MSTHIVLLFEPDRPSTRVGSSMASELEKAGYEVVETRNLNVAAALVFIDRRIEAVVIDAASEQAFPQLARGVSAIRPAIPLFSAAGAEMREAADKQAGHDSRIVISALDELFRQRVA